MLTNVRNAFHDISSTIKGTPYEHLVQNYTQWPYIALFTIKINYESLWSHVGWWANIVEYFRFHCPYDLTVAEIADKWITIMHENVGGFNVPVNYPVVEYQLVTLHNITK